MGEEKREKEILETMRKLKISRKEALLLRMYDPRLWRERRERAIATIEKARRERDEREGNF